MDKELELLIRAGAATEADFDGLTAKDVHAIKAASEFQARGLTCQLAQRAVDPATRTIEYAASVQVADRMGDVLIVEPRNKDECGCVTDNFMAAKGPFLYSHEPKHPVGRVLSTRVDEIKLHDGRKAMALIEAVQFLDSGKIPFSEAAYELALQEIGGVSVGFLPMSTLYVEDPDERNALGLGRWGVLFTGWEQLELSQVMVPANPYALPLGAKAFDPGGVERQVAAALKQLVEEKKLGAALVADFTKTFPLGPTDAAQRFAERVKGFVLIGKGASAGMAGVAGAGGGPTIEDCKARGSVPGLPVELGYTEHGALAKQVVDLTAERDALAARVRELEDQIPDRSMSRVRRAFERGSELLEELAAVVDDEAPASPAEPSKNFPESVRGCDTSAASVAIDLQSVVHHDGLRAALQHLMRELVKTSPGGARSAAPQAGDGMDEQTAKLVREQLDSLRLSAAP